MRTSHAAALTLLLALAHPWPVAAASRCGSVAGDADQVAATRAAASAKCSCSALSHGAYVACVTKAAKDAARGGSLRKQCSAAVIGCAARSTCGRPGFVTCCRTDAAGT